MSSKASPPLPLEDRIFAALLKAADSLSVEADQLIRRHSLTSAQYNVLRILRGAGHQGLPCSAIGELMISHDPDMTRLLDRLVKRDLVTRERQSDDRRVVKTHITSAGLDVLRSLDQPVREMHKGQFRNMTAAQLKALSELLEAVLRRNGERSS